MEKNGIIFKDNKHENAFYYFVDKMQLKHSDPERVALAYLLALNTDCRNHINDLYDFEERIILVEGLEEAWRTHTRLKTARLAFNLGKGCCYEGQTYKGSYVHARDLPR